MVELKRFSKSALVFILIIVFNIVEIYSQKPCKTPNGKSGICVFFKDCKFFQNNYLKPPVSKEKYAYLQKSKCETIDNNNVKVCCEINNWLPNITLCETGTIPRIFGGTVAYLGEFPWMALLQYNTAEGKQFKCGGMLINNRYVLTAGHCVRTRTVSLNLENVVLGEYNVKTDPDCVGKNDGTEVCADPPITVKIEQPIVHEDYRSGRKGSFNDIALLRLENEVTYTRYVSPICLPNTQPELSGNLNPQEYFAAGWGRTEDDDRPSDILRKVKLPPFDDTQCSQTYSLRGTNITSFHMCAGGQIGKDACSGDSGGPLVALATRNNADHIWYAAGIVSFGVGCGNQDMPGVYTRISEYAEWIISKLKE